MQIININNGIKEPTHGYQKLQECVDCAGHAFFFLVFFISKCFYHMDGIEVPRQQNLDSHMKHIECIAIVENANFAEVDLFKKLIMPGGPVFKDDNQIRAWYNVYIPFHDAHLAFRLP